MQSLEHYQREMRETARKASNNNGSAGNIVAWAMMLIGVVVTGTMTYSFQEKDLRKKLT